MQPKDKIVKAAWNHFGGTKDSVVTNISNAVRNGQIKVEADSMNYLLQLINTSIEEGYHRGYNVFEREIDAALQEQSALSAPVVVKKKLVGLVQFWTLSLHNDNWNKTSNTLSLHNAAI